MELTELLGAMIKQAKMYDSQQCDDDRYDEGYADAMYDAVAMVKELVKAAA